MIVSFISCHILEKDITICLILELKKKKKKGILSRDNYSESPFFIGPNEIILDSNKK